MTLREMLHIIDGKNVDPKNKKTLKRVFMEKNKKPLKNVE